MLRDEHDTEADPAPDNPAEAQARKFQRELSAGLTSLVLLSVLADVDGDLYGYEIAKRLSADALPAAPFKQGALYPVLRNMSSAGLLSSRVVPSYSGPPRRY
jgi:PadR family transcriptional regulator PadR